MQRPVLSCSRPRNKARGSRGSRRPARRGTDGFTLLEVLAGLLIMSILGAAIWGGVSASLRVSTRIHDTALASTRILGMDDRLRSLAARIRVPYWTPEYLMEAADGEMRIAYLDGDPAKSLVLKADSGTLTISDGSAVTAFAGFTSTEVAAAKDKAGNVFGVSVTVEEKGRAPFVITARFGSTPVMKGAAQ